MTKGQMVGVGIIAGFISTKIYKGVTRIWRSKHMTKEEMKVDIDLIVAMHQNNNYWFGRELNNKYEEIKNDTYIDKDVKIYGLNLITEEIEKLKAKEKAEKQDMNIDDAMSDLEKAMDKLLKAIKVTVDSFKT
jgi:hypothetical protein